MRHGHRHQRGNRSRFWDAKTREWVVAARIERFFEPAVLLALRDRPYHGYELVDAVSTWGTEYEVDSGNLYRMLRSLEDDGLVKSEWADGDRGGARRIYRLEPKGERVLSAWARSLAGTEELLKLFRERHAAPAPPTEESRGKAS